MKAIIDYLSKQLKHTPFTLDDTLRKIYIEDLETIRKLKYSRKQLDNISNKKVLKLWTKHFKGGIKGNE